MDILIRFALSLILLFNVTCLPGYAGDVEGKSSFVHAPNDNELVEVSFTSASGLPSNVITFQPRLNNWISIPTWLGGTWKAKSEVVLSSYDFRQQRQMVDFPVEVRIDRTCTLGAQQDNVGRIWHFVGTPYKRIVETADYCDYQQIERFDLITSQPAEVAVNTLAAVTRLDKKSGDVHNIFRKQTLTTYTPLKNDRILVNFDITDFDMQGRRLFASTCVCTLTKVEPFKLVDQNEQGNLLELFKEFFRVHGMSEFLTPR